MHLVKAKSILSTSNGMNVYRGCSHGCIYCDSRSTCYQMNHQFEDIEVKENAPELLEVALKKKKNRCMIATGAMSDPYNHYEPQLQITHKCLEVIDKYGFGVSILTKSDRIMNDFELLKSINKKAKVVVQMTLTTYDENLCKIVEPNVSTTYQRFQVLMKCKEAGIDTVVWLCPLLPFINDSKENLLGILDYCKKAEVKGIVCFGMGLTLREGDREYYYKALDKYFPGLKEKYIKTFGNRYELPCQNQYELETIFHNFCKENGIIDDPNKCFKYMATLPESFKQESLF